MLNVKTAIKMMPSTDLLISTHRSPSISDLESLLRVTLMVRLTCWILNSRLARVPSSARLITYRALHVPLLIPHVHPSVIKHALYVVLEGHDVLRHALAEDINLVLQLCPLLACLFVGNSLVVRDLGAKLGAGGAKEIGFL